MLSAFQSPSHAIPGNLKPKYSSPSQRNGQRGLATSPKMADILQAPRPSSSFAQRCCWIEECESGRKFLEKVMLYPHLLHDLLSGFIVTQVTKALNYHARTLPENKMWLAKAEGLGIPASMTGRAPRRGQETLGPGASPSCSTLGTTAKPPLSAWAALPCGTVGPGTEELSSFHIPS